MILRNTWQPPPCCHELQNSKRATKKKWVKAIREFTITMWYDQDIQDDVLGLSQEQFFEYLHNLEC